MVNNKLLFNIDRLRVVGCLPFRFPVKSLTDFFVQYEFSDRSWTVPCRTRQVKFHMTDGLTHFERFWPR